MNSLEKADLRFLEQAVDPAQRDAAIAELARSRARLFWAALLMSVAAILAGFSARGAVGITSIGAAAIVWSVFWKYEFDLRLLLVIRLLKT